ncbi:hypothetical protein K438DRAFT_1983865 [Mycena galopus ATCC 62051]|nr:hypothetical protein K438DRAFT_1983865 [Mycena galopus ATCC 62051]
MHFHFPLPALTPAETATSTSAATPTDGPRPLAHLAVDLDPDLDAPSSVSSSFLAGGGRRETSAGPRGFVRIWAAPNRERRFGGGRRLASGVEPGRVEGKNGRREWGRSECQGRTQACSSSSGNHYSHDKGGALPRHIGCVYALGSFLGLWEG